jgi:hypothetical protein
MKQTASIMSALVLSGIWYLINCRPGMTLLSASGPENDSALLN